MDGRLNDIIAELNNWASNKICKETQVDDIHIDEINSMPTDKSVWLPMCLAIFQIMKTTSDNYEILLSIPLCDSPAYNDIPDYLSPNLLGLTPISFYFALKGNSAFKETIKDLLQIRIKKVPFDTYFLQEEYIDINEKLYERTIMIY